VPALSTSPSAYGAVLLNSSSTADFASNCKACDQAIDDFCKFQLEGGYENTWLFTSNRPVGGSNVQEGKVGTWFPGKPAVDGAANRPVLDQCFKIFNAMASIASKAPGAVGATVNLAVNPAGQQSQTIPLPNGSGTGHAFSEAYPSYVLQIRNTTSG
ncbi:MAG: hypothetical protein LQ350_006242, partial [Teloschistes chrysophthalmus]